MIIQYVRNEQKHPIGVVVAIAKDTLGVSQCNPTDVFDKKRGLQIATGRARKGKPWIKSVYIHDQEAFLPVVEAVAERSRTYFDK